MSNIYVDKNKIDLLANAISAKSGEPLTLTLDEMVEAVDGIENGGGGITPSGNIDITSIGVTDVTNYATATVPQSYYELYTNHYFETVEGVRKFQIQAELDDRYNGGFIALSPYEAKLGVITTFDAIGTGTSITPTESSQTIGRVNTRTVLEGVVTINAIPSNYVGSEIPRRTSSDFYIVADQVLVPTGYYSENTTAFIDAGSTTAPATISGTAASITTGTNTLTLTKTVSITPSVTAGYISAGTAGNSSVSLTANVTVNPTLTASGATVTVPAGYYSSQATKSVSTTTHPNPTVSVNSSTGLITASHTQTAGYVSAGTTTGTSQLSTQAAATITPTTSAQTAVAAGKYTLGAVTVAAIPANYVDSSSLKTYYTGSSAPSNSLGSNGDLYFQTLEV